MPKPSGTSKPDPMAREVDRLLAGLAYRGPQPDDRPARGDAPKAAAAPRRPPRPKHRSGATTRGELAGLWARVGLGLLFGAMITQWPYLHGCGLPLVEYLGAVTMVIVAGGWIAVAAWTRRHAACHVLALLLVLWGIALAGYEILPRIGYAVQRWTWQC
jgi:hypothetical protein